MSLDCSIEIEEHDLLENPACRALYPELGSVKLEELEEDDDVIFCYPKVASVTTLQDGLPMLKPMVIDNCKDANERISANNLTSVILSENTSVEAIPSDSGLNLENGKASEDTGSHFGLKLPEKNIEVRDKPENGNSECVENIVSDVVTPVKKEKDAEFGDIEVIVIDDDDIAVASKEVSIPDSTTDMALNFEDRQTPIDIAVVTSTETVTTSNDSPIENDRRERMKRFLSLGKKFKQAETTTMATDEPIVTISDDLAEEKDGEVPLNDCCIKLDAKLLNDKSRYCKECLILFPSKLAKETHDMSAHVTENGSTFADNNCLLKTSSDSCGIKHDCKICDEYFFSQADLVQHLYEHVSDRYAYKCDFCDEKFAEKTLLEDHLWVHVESSLNIREQKSKNADGPPSEQGVEAVKRYSECPKCYSQYFKRKHFTSHMLFYHNEKPDDLMGWSTSKERCLKCKFCNQSFAAPQVLNQHIRDKHSQYNCDGCGMSFCSTRPYEKHLASCAAHRGKFVCPLCDKKCQNLKGLQQHKMKAHTPKRSPKAKPTVLGKPTVPKKRTVLAKPKTVVPVKVNVRKKVPIQRRYLCKICNVIFKDYEPFRIHLRRKHDIVKPLGCKRTRAVDNKQYSVTLLNQALVKCKRKPTKPVLLNKMTLYKCIICTAYFESIASFSSHKRSHKLNSKLKYNLKPCEVCGLNFTVRCIKAHLKLHLKNKGAYNSGNDYRIITPSLKNTSVGLIYKCKTCEIHSSSLKITKAHALYHVNNPKEKIIPSMECSKCSIKFLPHSLVRHIRNHSIYGAFDVVTYEPKYHGTRLWLTHFREQIRKKTKLTTNASKVPKPAGAPVYRCANCQSLFNTVGEVVIHMDSMPSCQVPKKTPCRVCKLVFPNISKHRAIFHKDNSSVPKMFIRTFNKYGLVDSQDAAKKTKPVVKPKTKDDSMILYKCLECTTHLLTESSLKLHKKYHEQNNRLLKEWRNCAKCGLKFSHFSIVRHMRLHHGRKCDLTIVPFNPRPNNAKPYPVPVLVRKTLKSDPEAFSLQGSAEEIVYQCKKCPKRYVTLRALEMHDNIDHLEKDHACPICRKIFESADVNTHLNVKSDTFKCCLCRRVLPTHEIALHSRVHANQYNCKECPKTFTKLTSLISHLEKAHPDMNDIEITDSQTPINKKQTSIAGKRTSVTEKRESVVIPLTVDDDEIFPHSLKRQSETAVDEASASKRSKVDLTCAHCGAVSTNQLAHVIHLRSVHKAKGPMACLACGSIYQAIESVIRHLKKVGKQCSLRK